MILFAGSAPGADPARPSCPIRIVVGEAPGEPPDLIGRFVAERLTQASVRRSWSRTGPAPAASSASSTSRRSAPDGYTPLVATMRRTCSCRWLRPTCRTPVSDFVPEEVRTCSHIKALWVNAALPPGTLREFVDSRGAPGAVGLCDLVAFGRRTHVDAALGFMQDASRTWCMSRTRTAAAGIAAVAAGDAQITVASITTGLELAQAGLGELAR